MLKFELQNKNVEAEIKSEILENVVLGAKLGLIGALWFKAVFFVYFRTFSLISS